MTNNSNVSQSFGNAVKWAYILKWSEQLIGMAFMVVLARILGPKDFGIIAIAMVYIAFLQEIVLEQGLSMAIIQRKGLEQDHLDTAFWAILGLSIVLALLSIGLSRWWAYLNHEPILFNVLVTLSALIPLKGLVLVQEAILQRKMDYRLITLRTGGGVLVGGVVGILMAINGYGVWALVGQKLMETLIGVILLWVFSNWRPGFSFSIVHLKQLLNFSLGVVLGKLAIFISRRVDAIMIGIFFGPVTVGIYRFADKIVGSLEEIAVRSIHTVSVPEFSRYQSDDNKLKQSVEKCLHATAMIAFPLLTTLSLISYDLARLMGDKWLDAAEPVRIFCLIGILNGLTLYTPPVLLAKGKVYTRALMVWAMALSSTCSFIIAGFLLKDMAISQQVNGMAFSRVVVYIAIFVPINFILLIKNSSLTLKQIVGIISPVLFSCFCILGIGYFIKEASLHLHLSPLLSLILIAPPSFLIGSITMLLFDSRARKFLQIIVSKLPI